MRLPARNQHSHTGSIRRTIDNPGKLTLLGIAANVEAVLSVKCNVGDRPGQLSDVCVFQPPSFFISAGLADVPDRLGLGTGREELAATIECNVDDVCLCNAPGLLAGHRFVHERCDALTTCHVRDTLAVE